MPNKTIYVADEDVPLFKRAAELAGGSASAAIVAALRRYLDAEEGRTEGFTSGAPRNGSTATAAATGCRTWPTGA